MTTSGLKSGATKSVNWLVTLGATLLKHLGPSLAAAVAAVGLWRSCVDVGYRLASTEFVTVAKAGDMQQASTLHCDEQDKNLRLEFNTAIASLTSTVEKAETRNQNDHAKLDAGNQRIITLLLTKATRQ